MTTARYPDINARHAAGQRFEPHRGRPMNDDAPPRMEGWKHLPPTLHPDFAEAAEPEPPPDFPTAELPPFARAFVEEYARFGGVVPDGPATFALGAMSCALAGKFEVCLKLGEPGARGYYQPLNLFMLVVADTGERKSDALDAAFRPVYDHQAELTDLWKAEGPAAEAEAEAAKASAADAAARLKKSPNDRDLRKAYADALARQEAAKAPPAPRLTTKDVTPERLADLMAEQGGRMCIAVDEAGFLRNALGKYNANGDTSLDVYLQGYSRQPVQIDRKSGPPIYMRRPTLTIAAGFQPGALRQAGSRSDFRDLGMLARFLLSVPRSLSGRRSYRTPAMRAATLDAWARTLRAMLTYPTPKAGVEPPYVALSRDADARLEKLFDEIEFRLDPQRPGGGELAHMRDWTAKFISTVGRLAGLFHFSAAAARGELDLAYERPVSGETMANAVAVGRYYLAHARHVYEVTLAPPEAARARNLHAAALRTLAWLFPDGRPFVTSAPIAALWPHPKAVPPPDAAFARETLSALAGGRADYRPTLQTLGIALGHLVGKPHEGLALERRGKAHGNVARWAVVRAAPPVPPSPPRGVDWGGSSASPPAAGGDWPATQPAPPTHAEAEYGYKT
ncbi:MAG TPA: YfjI family protein [Polyangiaceae bacterium]|nr:YfjI family protein [Polyangiaceae bacterium]